MTNNAPIVIYQSDDGQMQIDVRMENETVWLSQQQIAELFDTKRPAITKHLKNIYESEELDEHSTCSILEHMGNDGKQRYSTKYYNLDAILSVGYRVNSKNATKFRQWANKVLKDYLIKGYAVNNKLSQQKYDDLSKLVNVLGRTIKTQEKLTSDDATALINVVLNYNYALDTLDNYDYERLKIDKTTNAEPFHATYEIAMAAINALKAKFGGSSLFGHEKNESFKSSIGQIYQTFGGVELYPSVEEKAAMLLYLVTKNHSFSDGNKRIAATLFLWFMDNNHILYNSDGSKRIADNTLVALTLMIAESRTEEKDTMVKVVVNLINQNNV